MKLRKFLTVLFAGAVLLTGMHMRPLPTAAQAVSYGSETAARYAEEVAQIVNRERAAYGLEPLIFSEKLSAPAQVRAQEIQSVFSHTRPNGQSCFTAINEAGIRYTYAGENIAYGQRDPAAVMDAWMHSEGHRANILNARVTHIGVGVTERGGVYYWSQFFAASDQLETGTQTTAPAVTTTQRITTATTAATTQRVTTATLPVTTATRTTETVTTAPEAPESGGACGWQTLLERLCGMLGLDCSAWMR